jgi:hypothetical protein
MAEGVLGCFSAYGEVEVEDKKQFDLNLKPLDITASLDGTKVFVLGEGKVLVFSVAEDKVIGSIPVNKDLDRITLAGKGDALILSSSFGKKLETIKFQFIQKIDISGLPFKGPANAPVTIVVFSDYQ